jgi:hypothetical protein
MVLVIGLCCSCFSYFCSDFKNWCHGDKSHASSVSVSHLFVARPASSPCLPLMASSTASMGELAMVTPGSPQPVVAPLLGCRLLVVHRKAPPASRW